MQQIAIAPWGDVVILGQFTARLLARDTGAELLSLGVCFTQSPDAAAFVDDHRLILACREEVQEITFPRGRSRPVFRFPARMEHTAVGGGRLAASLFNGDPHGGDNGVRVYSLDGFQEVDWFDPGGHVGGIAISADGQRVAVDLLDADIVVRDVATKETRVLEKAPRHRRSALHFSPSGARLFAEIGHSVGGEIDAATGAVQSSFETSPWISAARYAGGDGVFVTGAGGLFLCGAGGRLRRSPVGDLGEGLDLSADGSFVCASGRSGDVACFSKKPVPPSTFAATREGLEDGGSGR
jgi:hypothetical protein